MSKYSKDGFTLVELSVVTVIIALLVSGILAGKSLIRASKLRSIITDVSSYKEAIDTFREKYEYYPGDMPNALMYWMNALADGDGNGRVDTGMAGCASAPIEHFRVWRHLTLAEMIKGQYTGQPWGSAASPCYRIGQNAPASSGGIKARLGLGGYTMKYRNNVYNRQGNILQFGAAGPNSNSPSGGASIINAPDAQSIDAKIDDGKAAYGEVFTTDGEQSNGTGAGCMDTAPNPDIYDLSNSDPLCTMIFWID